MYRYVLEPMGFHCFQLDYQERWRYILHLLWRKYDLIWACSSARGLITLLAKNAVPIVKGRMKDTKVVTRFHKCPNEIMATYNWKNLAPLFGCDWHAWVYDCRDELKALFPKFPLNNFCVVHNGVDLDFYKRREWVTRDENLVFTLSSWWENKRLSLLIEAMRHLPKHRLVVAGKFIQDHVKQECYRLADEMNPRIRFLGWITDLAKSIWLNRAGVFVMPSKSESWSTQTMEAMACETPVLRTEGGGANEFVPLNQQLKRNVSPRELAQKILVVSGDSEIGPENRERVRPYEWRNVRVETEQLLERVGM